MPPYATLDISGGGEGTHASVESDGVTSHPTRPKVATVLYSRSAKFVASGTQLPARIKRVTIFFAPGTGSACLNGGSIGPVQPVVHRIDKVSAIPVKVLWLQPATPVYFTAFPCVDPSYTFLGPVDVWAEAENVAGRVTATPKIEMTVDRDRFRWP